MQNSMLSSIAALSVSSMSTAALKPINYASRAANYCYQAPCTAALLAALFQPPRV